jgi:hypothetical protein
MKTAIAMFIVSMLACSATQAQCGKSVKWISNHSTFKDSSGNIARDQDEEVDITIAHDSITIAPPGEEEDKMNGPVTFYNCVWKDALNGNTICKATITNGRNESHNITLNITADKGKITAHIDVEDWPDKKITLTIEKFITIED